MFSRFACSLRFSPPPGSEAWPFSAWRMKTIRLVYSGVRKVVEGMPAATEVVTKRRKVVKATRARRGMVVGEGRRGLLKPSPALL